MYSLQTPVTDLKEALASFARPGTVVKADSAVATDGAHLLGVFFGGRRGGARCRRRREVERLRQHAEQVMVLGGIAAGKILIWHW